MGIAVGMPLIGILRAICRGDGESDLELGCHSEAGSFGESAGILQGEKPLKIPLVGGPVLSALGAKKIFSKPAQGQRSGEPQGRSCSLIFFPHFLPSWGSRISRNPSITPPLQPWPDSRHGVSSVPCVAAVRGRVVALRRRVGDLRREVLVHHVAAGPAGDLRLHHVCCP